MKSIIRILIFGLFYSISIANDHKKDENIVKDDQTYYKEGVTYYDNGEFKKSFIVFFNLSEKGDKDAIFNLSNMFYEGIGTTQDFSESLKYTWLCSLNGNKGCLKKVKFIEDKLDKDEFIKISQKIPEILENEFVNNNDEISAFKLGYWYEKISPEIDFEKSYLWYSVSVSAGVYKAMKMRDRVSKLIEKKKILAIQEEANQIYTKDMYFNSNKEKK